MRRRRNAILLLLAAALLWPSAAGARTLYWSELAVTARLDAEGRLHVRELQAMVFDGAWNGGERTFRLEGKQRIELHGMTRIDPETGAEIELVSGDLSRVDHYDWSDRRTLRWRSRLPSDPEFEDETLVYLLDYTMSGVVEKAGAGYVLNHDFAFASRDGVIERFTLDLELDPVWRPREGLERRYELAAMERGQSHVVRAALDYAGSGRPAGVHVPPPLSLRVALVAAAIAAIVVLLLRFQRFERGQGRYDPPEIPVEPDRAWIEEHLLGLRPEEVGALWDQAIGGPEVSALLARLVAEGKLGSRVEKTASRWKKDVLHLELLVDRDSPESYERQLVDKLFFDGRTSTSTEAVREHYKSTGFSPASAITPGLQKRLDRLPDFRDKVPGPAKLPGFVVLATVGALVAAEAVFGSGRVDAFAAILAVPTVLSLVVGYVGAAWRRRKPDLLLAPTLLFLIPLAFLVIGLYLGGVLLLASPLDLGWAGIAALLLFGVAVARSFFNTARTRDGREAVRRRRQLAALRRHLKRELTKPLPDLEDAWFPYLLAFGLARDVDKWSVAHAARSTTLATSSGGGFSGGSSGGGASWSGGGGAFGGAGAAAGWAAAATGLAAGVASPGSSGGGGGGGGGGGSSGGGGGGGW